MKGFEKFGDIKSHSAEYLPTNIEFITGELNKDELMSIVACALAFLKDRPLEDNPLGVNIEDVNVAVQSEASFGNFSLPLHTHVYTLHLEKKKKIPLDAPEDTVRCPYAKQNEDNPFLNFANAYFDYIKNVNQENQSCLARILGIYQVIDNVKNLSHLLIVMENLSWRQNISEQYDLKGIDIKQRYVDVRKRHIENFVERMTECPKFLSNDSREALVRALENDTTFLRVDHRDYGLLVARGSGRSAARVCLWHHRLFRTLHAVQMPRVMVQVLFSSADRFAPTTVQPEIRQVHETAFLDRAYFLD
ncbi:hypothetical protein FEM48_Zijuj07G0147900 [Ziziphus jujuba var. spinosa]|uniref:PIPK domain-containing protein n=1 Tax=Ziziphus jujuba var. spinosa TaxID=714518 RepID=A0A978V593_ZIZJJ|nr:hypothetical protein FEM48_Zijuj07G0147900 [Ziziphus jujuba var. spinosa]